MVSAGFSSLLAQSREWIDARFLERLPRLAWPERLCSQARHVLLGAGKAFRPALVVWTWQQLEANASYPPPRILDAALALEFVHTYSLIHDDLPCMDNDDFRRGRPTLHRLHGEADAVLAGDALLTAAFEVLASTEAPPDWIAASTLAVARAAGGAGMIAGQIHDIHGSAPDLDTLHKLKTGALIACSVELGALSSTRRRSPLTGYRSFGQSLGLYFQIVDDLLDVASGTGKTAGKDGRAGKVTFASDPASARARLGDLESEVRQSATSLGFEATSVEALLAFLRERRH